MKQAMQVLTSQTTNEWYTPPWIIELARTTLGNIDLDPASNATAQAWIRAKNYYTADDLWSGLARPWFGRVWLNPPFDSTPEWSDRLTEEYAACRVQAAIILVNSAPGYAWWERLWRNAPVCMLRERVCFVDATTGKPGGQAKKGQTLAYFGPDVDRFAKQFGPYGRVVLP